MAEAATRSDTTTADFLANGLARQRVWTQIVACAGVALVVALNTALPDIAAAGSTRPTFVMAAIAAVAAIIIPLFAPGRDGRLLCSPAAASGPPSPSTNTSVHRSGSIR